MKNQQLMESFDANPYYSPLFAMAANSWMGIRLRGGGRTVVITAISYCGESIKNIYESMKLNKTGHGGNSDEECCKSDQLSLSFANENRDAFVRGSSFCIASIIDIKTLDTFSGRDQIYQAFAVESDKQAACFGLDLLSKKVHISPDCISKQKKKSEKIKYDYWLHTLDCDLYDIILYFR